jgi:hypothetical protein
MPDVHDAMREGLFFGIYLTLSNPSTQRNGRSKVVDFILRQP